MGDPATDTALETATFGGGCFWCTEAVFRNLAGVDSVVAGYSGGTAVDASYKAVCRGTTGHAEVIQIRFDPRQASYAEVLDVFWRTHDPTTPNQQGNDVGPQYRSVIFYHDAEQRRIAEEIKQKLDASDVFDAPIVTEISPFVEFFPGEDYHQDYFAQNPRQPYCAFIIGPKLEKFKAAFADKLKAPADGLDTISRTDAEWKNQLTDEQFYVTRKRGTERAFTGAHWDNKNDGAYTCVCCGLPVFDSASKYDSGTGWPSFWAPTRQQHVATEEDRSLFSVRTEVKCARCDAHLGHVFDDGPEPTGLRYCINSAALGFNAAKSDD